MSCEHVISTSSLHWMDSITNSYPALETKLAIAKKNAFNGLGCIISRDWIQELQKNLLIPSDSADLEQFLTANKQNLTKIFKIPRPKLKKDSEIKIRLDSIQKYLDSLGYCYLQLAFFDIKKKTSLRSLMRTAQEM